VARPGCSWTRCDLLRWVPLAPGRPPGRPGG